MAFLSDTALDALLNIVKDNAEELTICSSAPVTYTEAHTTYKLGTKATPTVTGPADHTSGRKITVSAITDGTVSGTGTAGYWAISDVTGTALLAAGSLASSQGVTSGNTFTLTEFIFSVADPT